jgi:hypothetical protein
MNITVRVLLLKPNIFEFEQKWYFSPAFSPVTCWQLDSCHAVTKHIEHCPHYIREPKLEPFKLPMDSNEKECKKQL